MSAEDASERPARYSAAQKWLHWLIALLVIVMMPLGITMANMDDGPAKDRLYELHKSFGLTIIFLAMVRIAVRLTRGAPPVVADIPLWQRRAAYASHAALYVLIVLVPLAGWIGTSACCAPVNWFWTIPLTLPVGGGMEFAERVFPIHFALAFLLAAVALVHLSAALHHHFVRRDETLKRMLPGRD